MREWKLMPVELTGEMWGVLDTFDGSFSMEIEDAYAKLLAAAPSSAIEESIRAHVERLEAERDRLKAELEMQHDDGCLCNCRPLEAQDAE